MKLTFDQIKKISKENSKRYNRNVDCKALLKAYPNAESLEFEFMPFMEHHHYMGKPVETHLRCICTSNGILLLQDFSFEQFGKLSAETFYLEK